MGVSGLAGAIKLPTLRFRAKIMLGFAVVLAISAASMGFAFLGFERVSAGVATYRKSVTEADLARNIDRELISYRSLARYYVVTGKEEDGKAAQAAEAGLKDAIDQSMKGTTNPARLEQVTKLAREFRAFTKIFAEILKLKEESEFLTKNALTRSEMSLEYKFDDLASTAKEAEQQAVEFQAKNITTQFQQIKIATNNFVASGNQSAATSTLSRLSFLDNGLKNIPAADEKIGPIVKEINALLATYRDALTKLMENRKQVDGLITEMGESAEEIIKGAGAMKAALVSDQQRLESESNASIAETENLILMLAVGGFLLGAVLALLLGRGISRPMIAMCKAMRELAGGNFDVVLPGLGRKDELGEMAGAVEEFKVQAVAKAERDAATQEAQNKASSAARRAELIRFADEFEIGGRRDRRQCLGLRRAAGIGGGHADPHRGKHAKPVEPGRRRLGTGFQRHAIGGGRDRRAFGLRRRDRPARARIQRDRGMPPCVRPSRPTAGSANCRARRRRSATSSS